MLDGYLYDLLDTPEVQRTHYVTQNGFPRVSYPNLSHSRKVHQIGTAKIVNRMFEAMKIAGPASDALTDSFLQIAASAGI